MKIFSRLFKITLTAASALIFLALPGCFKDDHAETKPDIDPNIASPDAENHSIIQQNSDLILPIDPEESQELPTFRRN